LGPANSFAGGDRDCPDFSTQPEAQAFFEAAGPGDPHQLDADNDGIACEDLPPGDGGGGGGDGDGDDGGGSGGGGDGEDREAGNATITMERKGRDIFFKAPREVGQGKKLRVKNNTNPRQIGPHTFSLAKRNSLPNTNSEIKDCGKNLAGICGEIALDWHELDLETGQTGDRLSEVGKKGWDRMGNLKSPGDSWFVSRRGGVISQKVKARAGATLTFICAVHPFMQGKIKVKG
jgi:hypothetical protein